MPLMVFPGTGVRTTYDQPMPATTLLRAEQRIGCSHPLRVDVTELADPARVMHCVGEHCRAEWSEIPPTARRYPEPMTSGVYQATVTATIDGQSVTQTALYRGNPATDPDAELISGDDLVREGVTLYSNSGSALDTSTPA